MTLNFRLNLLEMRDIMYKEYENILSDEVYEYLRKSRSDDPLLSVEEVLAKHETM